MIVIGLSHRTAPIAVRERLAVPAAEVPDTVLRLRELPSASEALLLSTCNRVEVYAAPKRGVSDEQLLDEVTRLLGEVGGHEVLPHLQSHAGEAAVKHMFRVAASLDSLVVGEPQILGQLKEAIRIATEAKTMGPVLNAATRGAVQVAKRVRTQTQVGAGQVSVPSVAVDLAKQIFDDLSGHVVLLVGAGEMAETAAKLLARAGGELQVVNRSPERAQLLADSVGGTPRPWNDLDAALLDADVVVTSTASPTFVITRAQLKGLRRKRRGRSLFLIDIAVPRDVEPSVNDLENVYLYDVDDLSHVVAQSLEERRAEADRAEELVLAEVRSFEERRAQQAMTPIIVAMRERTRDLLLGELERSYKGRLKHLEDADKKSLGIMVDAAVNKLLHEPTRRLKDLAGTSQGSHLAYVVRQLFDLEERIQSQGSPDLEVASMPPAEAKRVADEAQDAVDEDEDSDGAADESRRVAMR